MEKLVKLKSEQNISLNEKLFGNKKLLNPRVSEVLREKLGLEKSPQESIVFDLSTGGVTFKQLQQLQDGNYNRKNLNKAK